MRTSQKVKDQFAVPELHDDRLTEWNRHLTKSLGPYDVIVGRDILKFIKIDLRFSDEIIEWDGAEMPFKDGDASTKEAHCAADSDPAEDACIGSREFLTPNVTKQMLKRSVKNKLSLSSNSVDHQQCCFASTKRCSMDSWDTGMVKKSNLNFKKEQILTMLMPAMCHDAICRH